MAGTSKETDDHAWEREFAPKITRRHVWGMAAVFAAWMCLMIGIAVHRWFGALQ